ncbi:MAG: biliverdin-producing heme oxygenase [Planctomycetota bacterium]
MSEHDHGHDHSPDPNMVPENIMDRLKVETWPLHQQAERAPRQRSMLKGETPVEGYAAHLGQLYLIHKSLEEKLADARTTTPAVAAVVTDEQFQVPYLVEDLEHFGVDPATVEPEQATTDMIATIEKAASESALKILGMHYVLEGSNNGGRFIAMGLRKVYGLTDKGTRYMDPYGERQRELWASFKGTMNEQAFSDAEQDIIVESAKDMFRGMTALGGGEIVEVSASEPVSG